MTAYIRTPFAAICRDCSPLGSCAASVGVDASGVDRHHLRLLARHAAQLRLTLLDLQPHRLLVERAAELAGVAAAAGEAVEGLPLADLRLDVGLQHLLGVRREELQRESGGGEVEVAAAAAAVVVVAVAARHLELELGSRRPEALKLPLRLDLTPDLQHPPA